LPDRTKPQLEENAGAVNVNLTSSDINEIEALLARYPNIGSCYPESMAKLAGK